MRLSLFVAFTGKPTGKTQPFWGVPQTTTHHLTASLLFGQREVHRVCTLILIHFDSHSETMPQRIVDSSFVCVESQQSYPSSNKRSTCGRVPGRPVSSQRNPLRGGSDRWSLLLSSTYTILELCWEMGGSNPCRQASWQSTMKVLQLS